MMMMMMMIMNIYIYVNMIRCELQNKYLTIKYNTMEWEAKEFVRYPKKVDV